MKERVLNMNKKGKLTMTITLGIMCFVLTMVIFIQFKTISQTDITQIETMREDELKAEIASIKTKYEEVLKEIEDTSLKIEEYKETINTDKEASDLLDKELEKSNDILGKNIVTGNRNSGNTDRYKI